MIGIITDKKDANIAELEKAFKAETLKANIYEIEKLALFTRGKESMLIHKGEKINFDAAFIKASISLAQFIEPLVDILISKGIYCNIKPNAYYTLSNLPLVYTIINSCKIPISKTHIVASRESLESVIEKFSFPVIVKTFIKNKKTQSIVIDNKKTFSSFVKSIKDRVDAITLQEFLEDDLIYAIVIGDETFAIKRKWDKNKFEHQKKKTSAAITDTEAKIAVSALKNIGLDFGVVKIIQGKFIGIRPNIDFLEAKKVLGKNVAKVLAEYYKGLLK